MEKSLEITSELAAEITSVSEVSPNEIPAEDYASGLSLIDLAEVLDQHKIWVESGGESGVKADLCGANLAKADLTGVNLQGAHLHKVNFRGADLSIANLRGASLVQADLRDTNLLGTELRGANLMGATIYGAEGMWVGRLGGTNLFDALLPESISAIDSSKAIAQATKVARWFYFLMFSVSLVCCLLVAFTTDLRLIVDSSALPIPRYGSILPMSGFYLGGPILLLILYLRFHFLLLRLWGSMAALPSVFPDGQTLEKDGPWYLMGLVRHQMRWVRDTRSPLSVLEAVLSNLLAYWVVPATLFFFWLRYLVRQDIRGTLLHVALVLVSVAAATCLPTIVSRAVRPGEIRRPKSKNVIRMALMTLRATIGTCCILVFMSFGVIRGLPSDPSIEAEVSAASVRRWAAQAVQVAGYRPYADLTDASLSSMPARGNVSDESIGSIPGARLNQISLRFARAYHAILVNAHMWRADLEGACFSEADLRGANLREASLRSGTFDHIRANHAVLVSADATGANLTAADLRDADFSYGTLENAELSNAKLAGASLYAVNLQNARLLRTDLSRADLRDTKMGHAVLAMANLHETDLSSAKLSEANLTGAQLKGTILLDADLRKADLRGAYLTGAALGGAQLDGANLEGADLRGAGGLTAAQVCSATHWRSAMLDADVLGEAQKRCGLSQ